MVEYGSICGLKPEVLLFNGSKFSQYAKLMVQFHPQFLLKISIEGIDLLHLLPGFPSHSEPFEDDRIVESARYQGGLLGIIRKHPKGSPLFFKGFAKRNSGQTEAHHYIIQHGAKVVILVGILSWNHNV